VSDDLHLIRLGASSKSDTIHRSTCRYAQRPNALRWVYADNNPDEDWAVSAPWLHRCLVCNPPSPLNAREAPGA
jgi:hypothetical protein